jgi:hypothetical protein
VNRDGADPHFVAGAMNPERDFAAIGDEKLLDGHLET